MSHRVRRSEPNSDELMGIRVVKVPFRIFYFFPLTVRFSVETAVWTHPDEQLTDVMNGFSVERIFVVQFISFFSLYVSVYRFLTGNRRSPCHVSPLIARTVQRDRNKKRTEDKSASAVLGMFVRVGCVNSLNAALSVHRWPGASWKPPDVPVM